MRLISRTEESIRWCHGRRLVSRLSDLGHFALVDTSDVASIENWPLSYRPIIANAARPFKPYGSPNFSYMSW